MDIQKSGSEEKPMKKADTGSRPLIPWSAQNVIAIMAAIVAADCDSFQDAVNEASVLYCMVGLEIERDHLPTNADRRKFDEAHAEKPVRGQAGE
jgi:hypothetical protein